MHQTKSNGKKPASQSTTPLSEIRKPDRHKLGGEKAETRDFKNLDEGGGHFLKGGMSKSSGGRWEFPREERDRLGTFSQGGCCHITSRTGHPTRHPTLMSVIQKESICPRLSRVKGQKMLSALLSLFCWPGESWVSSFLSLILLVFISPLCSSLSLLCFSLSVHSILSVPPRSQCCSRWFEV